MNCDANAVQHVITMGFQDDLYAVLGGEGGEFSEYALSFAMEMSLGVLDKQQGAGLCRQNRNDNRERVCQPKADVCRSISIAFIVPSNERILRVELCRFLETALRTTALLD